MSSFNYLSSLHEYKAVCDLCIAAEEEQDNLRTKELLLWMDTQKN